MHVDPIVHPGGAGDLEPVRAAAATVARSKHRRLHNADIVIRGVLTPEEIAVANAAVDTHQHELARSKRELAGRGDSGPQRRDLRHMLGWEGSDRLPFTQMLAHSKVEKFTGLARNSQVGPTL